MTTRAQSAKRATERSGAPRTKRVTRASRRTRSAEKAAASREQPPTKSVRGSEHARQMKSATASSRHGRRGG
jgi:hypothetical protein